MLFPQSSPLLTKQAMEVIAKGEHVILRIGNTDLTMHYEQALCLSRWMREEATYIKRGTGRGKTFRSLGTLHDANAKPPKPAPVAKGVSIHAKPKLLTWHRTDVKTNGRLVSAKIDGQVFEIHFETALKISQWLRHRAREAMANAGDTRPWYELYSQE